MPREVIEARLRLDEVLDELMQAGQGRLVLEVIDLIRSDMRLMAKHARGVLDEPPRQQRLVAPDGNLARALAHIEAHMQRAQAPVAAGDETVVSLADHLRRRSGD